MAVNTSGIADKLKRQVTTVGEGPVTAGPPSEKQAEQKKGGMMGLLEKMQPEIQKALPESMRSERMIRLALTAFKGDSKLKLADPLTFIAAVMQASQLGLEPNTTMGEAYIIPRYNGTTSRMEATFQIGYMGILSLAHRTGRYKAIYAEEVYANDKFEYEKGLHPRMIHVPADLPKGEPVYYYAVYHLDNGGYDFKVWSAAKVRLHAQRYSEAFKKGGSSPWKFNFDSMAKKTVLLDLMKYAPKSIEFSQQLSMDNTVRKDVDSEPEKVIIDMEEEAEPQPQQREVANGDVYFDFGAPPPEQEYYRG